MDLAPWLSPDKADRHQDLAQELTREIHISQRKKKTFMFYYKKRGRKKDSRQIAFSVGGKRDTM